jgi:hypothetical protein
MPQTMQTAGNMSAGVAAGKQQPQTTLEPAGGPFIRHSQPGRRGQYLQSGVAFGGIINNPLVATPGYIRGFRLRATASGGTGTVAVVSPDGPFNVASLVTLKDSFGTPLIVAPGYEAFYLLPKYGGAFGRGQTRDITNLQSWQNVQTNGNWQFSTQLPLEFTKAYGTISGANASLLPTLTVNLNPTTTVYTTPPTGAPTIALKNEVDFYWLPEGVNIQPPGMGTTRQVVFQQAYPNIGSASTTSVQFPRLGGYIDFIVMELRDSTGARIDAWPAQMRIYVDGVPLIDSDINTIFDDMQIVFENTSRPVGVIALSRKTSLSQVDEGLLDTGETFLSTNPGTLIEVQGAPWGTFANAPATLNILVGQVVPAGNLIQGLPEM